MEIVCDKVAELIDIVSLLEIAIGSHSNVGSVPNSMPWLTGVYSVVTGDRDVLRVSLASAMLIGDGISEARHMRVVCPAWLLNGKWKSGMLMDKEVVDFKEVLKRQYILAGVFSFVSLCVNGGLKQEKEIRMLEQGRSGGLVIGLDLMVGSGFIGACIAIIVFSKFIKRYLKIVSNRYLRYKFS